MSHTRQQKKKSKKEDGNLDMLPPDFEPSEWDVICQRGKECFEHVGNRRFRATIERNLDRYLKVQSRHEKSIIVSEIVGTIRAVSNESMSMSGGGFVRKDLLTRQWYRVGDKVAREKAGQALRDAIKTRRATERKMVQDKPSDERCPFEPSHGREQVQHTFQSPINIEYAKFSDRVDDGNSSMTCGAETHFEGLYMIAPSQDSAMVLPPSRVQSHDMALSPPISSSRHNNASTESVTDSHFLNNQHQGFSFLPRPIAPPSKHFESDFMSELEPRPISSVAQLCSDDNMRLPIGEVRTVTHHEPPTGDRIGSMEYRRENERTSIMMGESQTRSTEESAALHFLTHLLQPETGNDISPYNKHFFVSSTNYWHSSHLDEFGLCCDIVGSERPTMQQLTDLANLGDSYSCVGSIMMDETSTFGMMDHGTIGAAGTTDKTMPSQGHPLTKSAYSQTPHLSLLQAGPQEQPFLPSKFEIDQFMTKGRGDGLAESGPRSDSRVCFPDIPKSNLPLLASTHHRGTNDWKNEL